MPPTAHAIRSHKPLATAPGFSLPAPPQRRPVQLRQRHPKVGDEPIAKPERRQPLCQVRLQATPRGFLARKHGAEGRTGAKPRQRLGGLACGDFLTARALVSPVRELSVALFLIVVLLIDFSSSSVSAESCNHN